MTPFQKISHFIGDLQKSDEAVKKRWLIGSTAISMTLVLIMWAFYFSSTIQNLNSKDSADNGIGFAATFSQGLKVISGKIVDQLNKTMESAQEYMKATNSVTIQPTSLEISNNIEPIAPKKFP